MRGLLLKIVKETWLGTMLFGVAFLIVEILLNLILPQILDQMGDLLERMPFIRSFISALLGVEIEGQITAQLMQAFVWVHPVVLTLLWAHEIIFCTRFPVAEIDRGTIDMLLGLPVSRRMIYGCETMGWLISGLLILGLGAVGYVIGSLAMDLEHRPAFLHVMLVLVNLLCVYYAVGGVTLLVSSLSDRRGRAISIVFGLVLVSFLLNFLAQFWDPARSFVFLSVLNYYQPALILEQHAIPWSDAITLLTVGSVGWIGGLEITARRSICTV